MERKEYSAGVVKLSFWVVEFCKVVEFFHDGKSSEQIKAFAVNENLFAAPTVLRANQIYHTTSLHAGHHRQPPRRLLPQDVTGL